MNAESSAAERALLVVAALGAGVSIVLGVVGIVWSDGVGDSEFAGTAFALSAFTSLGAVSLWAWLSTRRSQRAALALLDRGPQASEVPRVIEIGHPLLSLGWRAITLAVVMIGAIVASVVALGFLITIGLALAEDGDPAELFGVLGLFIAAFTVAVGVGAILAPVAIDPRRVSAVRAAIPDAEIWPNLTTASLRRFVAGDGDGGSGSGSGSGEDRGRVRGRSYLSLADGVLTVWHRERDRLVSVATVRPGEIHSVECGPVSIWASVVPGVTMEVGSAQASFPLELCPRVGLVDTKGLSAIRLRDALAA